ncbi:MAG TPA: histidinol-phosphate transaminase [Dehalococcoidales bacterium]|nr:histidinol-phosphate transaminase [Dehalococcoidales bacterium]
MLLPEPYIQKLTPPVHGGKLYAEMQELGIDPAGVLDFSVSTNPLGPPPGLREAVMKADLESYPDTDSNHLKQLLATKLGLVSANLIVGAGSTELIRLAATAYLGNGERALVLPPTYAEYALASRLVGAEVVEFELFENSAFKLDLFKLKKVIRQQSPRAIFICNPDNPTGRYLKQQTIQKIIEFAPDSLIVLDEAYIGFVDRPWAATGLLEYPNVLIIRSMTKDYGIAGLRLGYAIANPEIVAILEKVKPPWNVSSIAQAAGLFVLEQDDYLESMRAKIAEAGRYLKANLLRLGLKPLPSSANFFLVRVGDAAGLRRALLAHAILVRDCTSFGLPHYIRLAVRSLPDCRHLINALQKIGVKNYDR